MQIYSSTLYHSKSGRKVGPLSLMRDVGRDKAYWLDPFTSKQYLPDGRCFEFGEVGQYVYYPEEDLDQPWDRGHALEKKDEPLPTPADLTPTVYTKASLLEAAAQTVKGRGLNYGKPEDNFARIAAHWTAFLTNRQAPFGQLELRAGDVAIMMVLMKAARLENQPNHPDSWIDIAGYAACGAEITSQPAASSQQSPTADAE